MKTMCVIMPLLLCCLVILPGCKTTPGGDTTIDFPSVFATIEATGLILNLLDEHGILPGDESAEPAEPSPDLVQEFAQIIFERLRAGDSISDIASTITGGLKGTVTAQVAAVLRDLEQSIAIP